MTMSDTLIVISLIVGFGTALTSAGLLFQALFPGWVARAEERARGGPVTTVIAGVASGLLVFLVAAVLLNAPNGLVKFAGLLVLLSELVVAFAGTAAVARIVGARLPSSADRDRPWMPMVRGWVVIYLASLLPILGWFVFLPLALLSGFGAALRGIARPKPAPPPPAPAPAREKEEVLA
jgi:uncharacterized membrane protein